MAYRLNSPIRQLEIEYLPTGDLIFDAGNVRKHSKSQISKLAAGIRAFGFTNPIQIDEHNRLIAGEARLRAAPLVPLELVPCVRIKGLDEQARKALAIADNKLGDLSTFDVELLSATLAELDGMSIDIELTGFDTAELDILIDGSAATASAAAADAADIVPPVAAQAVTRVGDLWELGKHRLLCGDALLQESFDHLLGTEKADLVFADFPYNVPIMGHVSGLGKARFAEFPMASGEMTRPEFTQFLTKATSLLAGHSRDGSIHFICMDHRHMGELLEAGTASYTEMKNLCIWDKGSGGMGSLWRSQHELVFVFKHGSAPHVNNVQLGKFGRYRTNVWRVPGMNSFGRGRDEALASHPTVKPVTLVADAIRDCSNRGDLVLDSFSGSGTTIMAAERTGRCAAAIELDPLYVDVAIRRWQNATGQVATLSHDGRSFAEVERERAETGTASPGDQA